MLIRAMSVNEENTFAATLESQGLYGRSLWASVSTEISTHYIMIGWIS